MASLFLAEILRRRRGSHPKPTPGGSQSEGRRMSPPASTPAAHEQESSASPTGPEGRPQTWPVLWDRAKEKLSEDDRKWIDEAAGDFSKMAGSEGADEILELMAAKQQQCKQRSSCKSFNLHGREAEFLVVADQSISWLNRAGETDRATSSYDLTSAILPWAAMRRIIQTPVVFAEEMASLLVIVEISMRIVHRCQIFELLYLQDPAPGPAQELESAIIELYYLVLQALGRVERFLTSGTASQTTYVVLHSSEGDDGLLSSIDEGEVQVEKQVSACKLQQHAKTDEADRLQRLLDLDKPMGSADANMKGEPAAL